MDAVVAALWRGVLDAATLRQRLEVSAPTMMRAIRRAGASVVRIGRARATRYGLCQVWPGLDATRFPVFHISDEGAAQSAGEIITLASRQTVWMPAGTVADALPVEIADARPSGFLGRHFAATHVELRLPLRLDDWSDHHVLLAMSRRGEDLPGSVIVGDESFARWQALDVVERTRGDYPDLAEATIAGHPPGSSAGGERPKFGVFVDGRHRLVKFAPRSADGAARRWCDLLLLEALALDVLSSHGLLASCTQIVETSSHWFLESERFDRAGPRGRRAVLSLAAVHDDPARPWAEAAVELNRAGRLSDDDARRLRWLDAFGAFIGNTDRHPFNVLFFPDGARLRLAPAFDQVSMLYAPLADGQAPIRPFTLPKASSFTLDVWDEARDAAREFWERATDDDRVSGDMREVCSVNAGALMASSRPPSANSESASRKGRNSIVPRADGDSSR